MDSSNIDPVFQKVHGSREGLTSEEALQRLAASGPNLIFEPRESLLRKIGKYFWGPIPWMIEVAAILSLIVRHYPDFIFITILLLFNALVAFYQEHQAGNAIDALKKKLALKARVVRDGKWQEIDAGQLVPGDVIRIRLGDIIPADGILFEGDYLTVDQSSLTGESLPVSKKGGDPVFSGSIAHQGEMDAVVTATGSATYFGKTVALVESAQPVSHFQKAVLQIGDFLIYSCLVLVVILFVVQISRGEPILEFIKFGLILVVASIPVAMPAVLSVTMAVGALSLSRMQAIVTRLESIEELAGIDTLLCDKTGTLTQNKLQLKEPILYGKATREELLLMGALASRAEDFDPIDLAIIAPAKKIASYTQYTQKNFVPFDPVSKKSSALITSEQGVLVEVAKGAPQVILSLCHLEDPLVKETIEKSAEQGDRTLGVAKREAGKEWEFLGLLPLFDPPRVDSKETIEEAKVHGINVKMVTGDNLAIARQIAEQLGIGKCIMQAGENVEPDVTVEGFAQVFPENKFQIVKAFQSKGHLVGMTGDGVNDAPALKQADLGIAVSGATDAARSAASLVLTAPGLSVIIQGIEEARRIFERMNTYAIYRITETICIMIFIVLAILIYQFYPISALMIIILALLNDIPIMTIAYDRTDLPEKPVRWNMHRVLLLSAILGGIGVIETFLLFILALKWFHLPLDQLRSLIFLHLSVAGHLTLFIARTRHPFFFKPFPSPVLLAAILATQGLAVLIVGFGWFFTPLPWIYIGIVWAYCLVWMFLEDWAKLLAYHYLELTHPHHKKFLKQIKKKI